MTAVLEVDVETRIEQARRVRTRERLDHLDYLRLLLALAEHMTQRELAGQLGISQPTVANTLKTARSLADVPEGFSGADPTEIAERHWLGLLSRADTIDQLGRWNYRPYVVTESGDWLDDECTWEEVEGAQQIGLIDMDMYAAAQELNERLYS
ncbi:MAG: hypothetical protein LBI99_01215 [Propionibacteriaceae bacterium]|jgi:transcriptional regulator with XRE-family HTH domain|nr:hypothetical protein [Propionibacteriaceae bacterium]